ncbi:MAG: thermonuclease family protein [Desulfovibrio sp.]|nr:thermonuclease family protein [Desulfovibrio sp.]
MRSLLSFLACTALLFVSLVPASARTGFVFKVEDDGLIAVSNWPKAEKADAVVRMYGINMPSLRQPFGKEARAFLLKYLRKGEEVEISPVGDRNEEGLEEVLLQVDGHALNYALVDEGLAWVDRQSCLSTYCRRWYIVEHRAVTQQKGIWSLQMETPPWQWSR